MDCFLKVYSNYRHYSGILKIWSGLRKQSRIAFFFFSFPGSCKSTHYKRQLLVVSTSLLRSSSGLTLPRCPCTRAKVLRVWGQGGGWNSDQKDWDYLNIKSKLSDAHNARTFKPNSKTSLLEKPNPSRTQNRKTLLACVRRTEEEVEGLEAHPLPNSCGYLPSNYSTVHGRDRPINRLYLTVQWFLHKHIYGNILDN